jgi:hypothetical protein
MTLRHEFIYRNEWELVRYGVSDTTLLEKWFISTSGIYFLYRLISVADTINKK